MASPRHRTISRSAAPTSTTQSKPVAVLEHDQSIGNPGEHHLPHSGNGVERLVRQPGVCRVLRHEPSYFAIPPRLAAVRTVKATIHRHLRRRRAASAAASRPTTAAIAPAAMHNPTGSRACSASRASAARAVPDVSMIATRWLVCSYDTTPCDPTQAPTFQAGTGTVECSRVPRRRRHPWPPSSRSSIRHRSPPPDRWPARTAESHALYPRSQRVWLAGHRTAVRCVARRDHQPACIFYDVTAGSSAQPCKVSGYATNAPAGSSPASTCGTQSGDANGIMEIGGHPVLCRRRGLRHRERPRQHQRVGCHRIFVLGRAFRPQRDRVRPGGDVHLACGCGATGGFDVYQGRLLGSGVLDSGAEQCDRHFSDSDRPLARAEVRFRDRGRHRDRVVSPLSATVNETTDRPRPRA